MTARCESDIPRIISLVRGTFGRRGNACLIYFGLADQPASFRGLEMGGQMFHILPHDTSFRFHACGMILSVVPASLEIIELCTNITTFTLHSRLTQIACLLPAISRDGRQRWKCKKEKSRTCESVLNSDIRVYDSDDWSS